MSSSKRFRDDNDYYRSRETSRRKDERSYYRDSNQDRDYHYHHHDKNYDKSNGKDYRSTNKAPRDHDRKFNETQKNYTNERNQNSNNNKQPPPPPSASTTSTTTSTTVVEPDKPFVKEKVNFNLSGKLAQDTNMQNGVIVKYSEPIEATKPTKNWRLYPFKNDESLPFIPIHKKSYYLIGRDRKVVDIPLDHPSVSKQHAVVQHRCVELERNDGTKKKTIRPYLMDLGSSNKTYLNNNEIDPMKYYQLLEKDVIKFGFSTREYVVLIDHENE